MDINKQQPYGDGYSYPAYPPAPPPGYPPPGGAGPSYAAHPPGGSYYAGPPPPKPPAPHHMTGYDVEAQAAATFAAAFAEKRVRAAFVRKVFSLVFLQLAVTIGVAAVFLFVTPVNEYVAGVKVCSPVRGGGEQCWRLPAEGQWVFWTSWALTLATMIALACSTSIRRKL